MSVLAEAGDRLRRPKVESRQPSRNRDGHTSYIIDMDNHMKTTLNIDDSVMAQLKREAARQKRTMSDLVETALRNLFQRQRTSPEVSPLPIFESGGAFVDIGDRDALYQAMEGR